MAGTVPTANNPTAPATAKKTDIPVAKEGNNAQDTDAESPDNSTNKASLNNLVELFKALPAIAVAMFGRRGEGIASVLNGIVGSKQFANAISLFPGLMAASQANVASKQPGAQSSATANAPASSASASSAPAAAAPKTGDGPAKPAEAQTAKADNLVPKAASGRGYYKASLTSSPAAADASVVVTAPESPKPQLESSAPSTIVAMPYPSPAAAPAATVAANNAAGQKPAMPSRVMVPGGMNG